MIRRKSSTSLTRHLLGERGNCIALCDLTASRCCLCVTTSEPHGGFFERWGQSAVPFLFSDAFEEDILHVTVAETAEQTGHDGALRNPPALAVRSGNVTANS